MPFAQRFLVSLVRLAPALPIAWLAACGNTPSDTGGDGTNQSADTAPVVCPFGTIHPRVCTMPITETIPGSDTTGDYAIDVNNDVNAACPDGYTLKPDSTEAAGICCAVPSPTDITECAQPWSSDPAVSSEVWNFPATQCNTTTDAGDPTWAAAHPNECGDDALAVAEECDYDLRSQIALPAECATAATVIHVPWRPTSDGGLNGP